MLLMVFFLWWDLRPWVIELCTKYCLIVHANCVSYSTLMGLELEWYHLQSLQFVLFSLIVLDCLPAMNFRLSCHTLAKNPIYSFQLLLLSICIGLKPREFRHHLLLSYGFIFLKMDALIHCPVNANFVHFVDLQIYLASHVVCTKRIML